MPLNTYVPWSEESKKLTKGFGEFDKMFPLSLILKGIFTNDKIHTGENHLKNLLEDTSLWNGFSRKDFQEAYNLINEKAIRLHPDLEKKILSIIAPDTIAPDTIAPTTHTPVPASALKKTIPYEPRLKTETQEELPKKNVVFEPITTPNYTSSIPSNPNERPGLNVRTGLRSRKLTEEALAQVPSVARYKKLNEETASNASNARSAAEWASAAAAGQPTQDPEEMADRKAYNDAQKPFLSEPNIPPGTDIREGFTAWMLENLIEAARQPNQALAATIPTSELTKLLDEKYIPFLKSLEKRTPEEQNLMDLYQEIIDARDKPSKAEEISDRIGAPITKEELNQLENEGFSDILASETEKMTERHEQERKNRLLNHDHELARRYNNSWNSSSRRAFEKDFQEREDRINRDFERSLFHHRSDMNYKNKAEAWARALAKRDYAARQAPMQQALENTRYNNSLSAARDANILRYGVDQRKMNTFERARHDDMLQRQRAYGELDRKNQELLRQRNAPFANLGNAGSIANGGPPLSSQQLHPNITPYQAPPAPRSAMATVGGGVMTAYGLQQEAQNLEAQRQLAEAKKQAITNQNVNGQGVKT